MDNKKEETKVPEKLEDFTNKMKKELEILNKLENLKAKSRELERRRRKSWIRFNLGMAFLTIFNLLFFILSKSFYAIFSTGFILGMWVTSWVCERHCNFMRKIYQNYSMKLVSQEKDGDKTNTLH